MEIDEILSQLENNTREFPRLALERAIEEREVITPILIETLEKLSNNLEELLEKEDYILHIHALYLLAQFREISAYPVIIKFFSVPGDIALDVTGDVVTEDLGRILACVSHGNIELIKSLVENPEANEYVRSAALETLLVLLAQEVITREQVIQYYANLYSTLPQEDDYYIWSTLVTNSAQICAIELQEQIEQAFEKDLVDLFVIDQEDVNTYLVVDREEALKRLRNDPKYSFIKDVISEMENWSCFQLQERHPLYDVFIPEEFSLVASKKSKNQAKKKKMQKESRRKNRSKKK
ncbi:DUF1186 domain-containing protein [Nostoc sp. CCY0012]|uniref:DUF1186 domain-containing protein n=1 Tax=Nostoc sp. CCY0012 TaxID=1056123 RepID=UPI0039C6E4B6